MEKLGHDEALLWLCNNDLIFNTTCKFEWMFMENGIIHSSMSFLMKLIFKEVIYSLFYQAFHFHLDSVKHLAMMHLSSRFSSMNT